jgi:hypothetical protein
VPFSNIGVPPVSLDCYPAWSKKLVAVVDRAMSEAWRRMLRDHSILIHAGDEDTITDQLRTELVAMRRENRPRGFGSAFFGVPTRDSKQRDCYGASIDQSPDLTIYPAHPRRGIADDQYDALFFECKVLDRTRGMDLYRLNGIERFTTGRYAWRMPHAGMIAYVLDKHETSRARARTAKRSVLSLVYLTYRPWP